MFKLNPIIAEFIGTFLFISVIFHVVKAKSTTILSAAPVTIGLGLALMIYLFGPFSGGHFNPAVSLAMVLHNSLPAKDFGFYLLAQMAGAVCAYYAFRWSGSML